MRLRLLIATMALSVELCGWYQLVSGNIPAPVESYFVGFQLMILWSAGFLK